MGKPQILRILNASFHRNGVSGMGFYAIVFEDAEYGLMIASLFDEDGYCAVYSIDELNKHNINFAQGNSWRGDYYEAELRPMLDAYLADTGTNRIGPFGLPQD